MALSNAEMLDDAISAYKKSININSHYAKAHYNLGVVYYKKGVSEESIKEWNKAIAIDPNFAEPNYNLAIAYYKKGQYDLAIKHCDKAVALGVRVHPRFLEDLKGHRK